MASGVTPLVLRSLPFGSYTIRITLSGHAPSDHRIVLDAQREAQSLEVALQEGEGPANPVSPVSQGAVGQARQGSFLIESRPPGATVFFNDQRIGQTPLAVVSFQLGREACASSSTV